MVDSLALCQWDDKHSCVPHLGASLVFALERRTISMVFTVKADHLCTQRAADQHYGGTCTAEGVSGAFVLTLAGDIVRASLILCTVRACPPVCSSLPSSLQSFLVCCAVPRLEQRLLSLHSRHEEE